MAEVEELAKRKRAVRSDAEYVASANRLSKFVPGLKKYRKRKKLKRAEKSAITRREKQLRYVFDKLHALTPKQAKKMKGKLYKPGVHAIELTGFAPDAKVRVVSKNTTTVLSNGRRWLLWPLDRIEVTQKRGMKSAAKQAFTQSYPIEIVKLLAASAFKNATTRRVYLWAAAGVVGQGFDDLQAFSDWVDEKWSAGRYLSSNGYTSDPAAWINGIAVLMRD